MDKLYLGVDIGGTAVKMGLVTGAGNVLRDASFRVDFDRYQTPIIDTALFRSRQFLESCEVEPSQIEGIGISATGQIDKNGVVMGTCGLIAGWEGTDIVGAFRRFYRKPVATANDVNCALLGERWSGAAVGAYKNVLMITIGTGIGGAALIDGRLMEGAGGIAGEVGHIPIRKDGLRCSCGNRGCYEMYASTRALIRRVGEKGQELAEKLTDGRAVFKAAAEGNKQIQDVVNDWIDDVCTGLVGMVHIFNPDLLLVGGGVCTQKELFMDPLEKRLRDRVMPAFDKGLRILPAKLGNTAGLVGAVSLLAAELSGNMEREMSAVG